MPTPEEALLRVRLDEEALSAVNQPKNTLQ
jgi:hypothetical protein